MNALRTKMLHRYILGGFVSSLSICLFALVSLFFVVDFFDNMRVFIREEASFAAAASYMLYKIPLMLQLMLPISVLIATLLSVGRLSQSSEIIAMRACGASVLFLAKPIIFAGLVLCALSLYLGETLVPWAVQRAEDIDNFDIRNKLSSGDFSKTNFWYRNGDTFYRVGLYDARNESLRAISAFKVDGDFSLFRRTDAQEANWKPGVSVWVMKNVVESLVLKGGDIATSVFFQIPLLIEGKPDDFFALERNPDTMGYASLGRYIDKLRREALPVTRYLVKRSAKLAFPFVNVVVVLLSFPFAIFLARAQTMTRGFMIALVVGFSYYVVQAFALSLGVAELLPVWSCAWAANILLGSVGAILLLRADNSMA